ncbi:hypothetical protein G6F60_014589 [Rhizopus arrhizus]|nr:hypothetical protein G6F32_016538 [Rhizopus arrhizus]KAG1364602.1 hypothetical protein G6F61_013806 [Rhizopus arrhizus]KAG1386135.1 hypothetical protein G6F60_014589 [Rhizopus arrhizus]
MLRDLEAGQQVEAEQIVGDMLARARKADQEALLLQGADPRAGLERARAGRAAAGAGRARGRHGARSGVGAARRRAPASAAGRCPAVTGPARRSRTGRRRVVQRATRC